MTTAKLDIDVVSDVVCPWCYVGLKRLRAALAAIPDVATTVRWRPYQLDPSIPSTGVDRRDYMVAKFGSEERIRDIHARIVPLGSAEGIAFDFDAISVAPNTLDAHRLIRWAGSAGADVQNRLVETLFAFYFEQGKDVGNPAVLVEAAAAAGMDPAIAESLLPTDSDADAVRTEIETAGRMGVTGVPCFILGGRYAVMGAQDSATLAEAIRKAASSPST